MDIINFWDFINFKSPYGDIFGKNASNQYESMLRTIRYAARIDWNTQYVTLSG